MMGFYPEIGTEALPSGFLLQQLDAPWFEIVFQLVVFGTLIATSVGLIAQGYGVLTWFFIAVIVVPMLTVGIFRIARAHKPA